MPEHTKSTLNIPLLNFSMSARLFNEEQQQLYVSLKPLEIWPGIVKILRDVEAKSLITHPQKSE